MLFEKYDRDLDLQVQREEGFIEGFIEAYLEYRDWCMTTGSPLINTGFRKTLIDRMRSCNYSEFQIATVVKIFDE